MKTRYYWFLPLFLLAMYAGGQIPGPGSSRFQTFRQQAKGASLRNVQDRLTDAISVRDFGAMGDDITDDTAAVQAALDAAAAPLATIESSNQGGKVIFPCRGPAYSYLITQPVIIPHGITIMGDVTPGCRIHYRAAEEHLAAFVLLHDSVTIRDIKLYSDDTGDEGVVPPKVAFLIGLATLDGVIAGESGHHQIHDISVSGWASQALVYQIASEENSFSSNGLYLSGGGAKYVLYVSNTDGLGICGGLCPTQTNFHNWYSDMHVVQYPTDVGTPTTDSAGVFFSMNGQTGDIHFNNVFVGMGPPGGPLGNRHGSCFRLQSADTPFFSGTGDSFTNGGCEGGDQMFYFERNSGLGMTEAGYFSDLTLTNNTHQGIGTLFMYAEDNTVIYRSFFMQNKATEPQENSSLYDVDASWIHDGGLGDLAVRDILAHSMIEKSFGALTYGGAFDNHISQSGSMIAPFLLENNIDIRWKDTAGTRTQGIFLGPDNNFKLGATSPTATNGFTEVWAQGYLSSVFSKYGIVPRLNNTQSLGGTGDLWQFVLGSQILAVNYGAISGAVFTGSGLNDATAGGGAAVTPTAGTPDTYTVQILTTATPNTWEWNKNGGTWQTGYSITAGLPQSLASLSIADTGITITFASATGHTIGDHWTITATNTAGSVHMWSPAACATPPQPCEIAIYPPANLAAPYFLKMPAAVPTVGSVLSAVSTVGTEWTLAWNTPGSLTGVDASKINGTAVAGLATGIYKNTNGTGVPSIAVLGDLPSPPAWTAWTPVLTTSMGTASLSTDAAYSSWGKRIDFRIDLTVTLSGTPANSITISLGTAAKTSSQFFTAEIINGGSTKVGLAELISGALTVYQVAGTYSTGTCTIRLNGVYEGN